MRPAEEHLLSIEETSSVRADRRVGGHEHGEVASSRIRFASNRRTGTASRGSASPSRRSGTCHRYPVVATPTGATRRPRRFSSASIVAPSIGCPVSVGEEATEANRAAVLAQRRCCPVAEFADERPSCARDAARPSDGRSCAARPPPVAYLYEQAAEASPQIRRSADRWKPRCRLGRPRVPGIRTHRLRKRSSSTWATSNEPCRSVARPCQLDVARCAHFDFSPCDARVTVDRVDYDPQRIRDVRWLEGQLRRLGVEAQGG